MKVKNIEHLDIISLCNSRGVNMTTQRKIIANEEEREHNPAPPHTHHTTHHTGIDTTKDTPIHTPTHTMRSTSFIIALCSLVSTLAISAAITWIIDEA